MSTTPDTDPRQQEQEQVRDSINEQKGRGISTPTTVEEQVDQLDDGTEEHRRRDPLEGARRQHDD